VCAETKNNIKFDLFLVELDPDQVRCMDPRSMRNITLQDFAESLKRIRKSVSPSSLVHYEKWNSDYGDVSL